MATAVISQPRSDNMPGLNSLELDEGQNPSSFNQAHVMPATSGMFSYCQTAQVALSAWDTTAEGPQNFHEYPDGDFYRRGDSEDFSTSFGQTSRQAQPDAAEDYPRKWTTTAAAADSLVSSSEPMQRIASVASTAGHRSRKGHKSSKHHGSKPGASSSASKRKNGAKLSSAPSGPSDMSDFDMRGNSSAFQGNSGSNAQMSGADHYLSPPESVSSQSFFPGILAAAPEGIPFADLASGMPQHVNPLSTQMHLDYDPSLSPPHSCYSGSSGSNSPPSMDDAWAIPLEMSPTETGVSSPDMRDQDSRLPSFASHGFMATDLHTGPLLSAYESALNMPVSGLARQTADCESARTHRLYKDATPHSDGLFHCPWEGDASCNHKPEKLKCNYDKYVDSHLKPYRCKLESCESAKFSSTACLLRHEREAHAMHGHGDKPYLCTYPGCDRANPGNGFPRHWNLKDHMRRVHSDLGDLVELGPSGQASTSGPGSSTKGKKRKSKDSSDGSSNRKAATSKSKSKSDAGDSAASSEPAMGMDESELLEQKKTLVEIAQGLELSNAPESINHLYDSLDHLRRITERHYGRPASKRHSG